MKTLSLLGVLLLGACAPTLPGGGQSAFEWVGCHKVTTNPGPDGSVAFGPFGVKTTYIFFKQINDDGSVGKVTTSTPC